ncbi:DUF5005 domain-containing protein [Actinomadura nitritigenes]|uniref:DUF5005 domain-containing protein n=1 Tax=Actinomadura nitritigenes TaxID=134602 RepID=UPI003D8FE6D6
MRLLVRAAAASTLAATALLAPSAAAHAAALTCGGSAAPTFGTATPDTSLNAQFTSYGNGNALLDDWTGADSTYSVKLPDGRTVFGFSDTFLGKVNADGSRPMAVADGGTTPFVNNTFVVRSAAGALTGTAHGGTAANPTALLPPRDASHVYWAGDMTMNGGEIQQPYREYKVGSGDLDVTWDANVLARFSTSDLTRPASVTSLPSGSGVMWGSALLRDGGYTYVYGTEDLGSGGKHMYVARVAGTDLRGTWSYLAAGGAWSPSESAAVEVLGGVSNEFSVSKRGNFYVLLTQDTKDAFSAQIDTYLSCSPAGPFTDERTVYNTPEGGPFGSYGDPDVYTYNAHAHASLTTANRLVVSYNVNSLDTTTGPTRDVYRDVSIYRPRFVDVPVTG